MERRGLRMEKKEGKGNGKRTEGNGGEKWKMGEK
jgi:hypothetical protein